MLMLYHFDFFSLYTCRLCDVSGKTCGFPVCKWPISTDLHDRRWQSVQCKLEFPWWAGPGTHCWGWHREAAKPGPYQCWRISSDSVEGGESHSPGTWPVRDECRKHLTRGEDVCISTLYLENKGKKTVWQGSSARQEQAAITWQVL